jgi:hypothetical protein
MKSLNTFRLVLSIITLGLLIGGCTSPGESTDLADVPSDASGTSEPAEMLTPTSEPEPPTATPTLSPTAQAFLGQWMNLDQDSGGYSWFTIRRDGDEAVVHFWGQCTPGACDVGEHRFPITDLDDGIFVFGYEFANGTNTSEFILQDDLSVVATNFVDFTVESGGEDNTRVYTFQNALEVTGIPALVGNWVYDQAVESEFTYLSVALIEGHLVVQAKVIIDGQETDLGESTELDADTDDGFYVDYEYPGGGLISGECRAGGDGTLIVEFFSEHMVDNVYTPHESVFVMQRMD